MKYLLLLFLSFGLSTLNNKPSDAQPVFHFKFDNAAGQRQISDTSGKFSAISETNVFHVEKDTLNIAAGVRIAMGARFKIPAANMPDLSKSITTSAWIFKSSTPDMAPILAKGLSPELLQFTFGIAWRYPYFHYRNEAKQSQPKGIWHSGAFGTRIKYIDPNWLLPDAKLAETAGMWYHVASTFDEGKVRLYINGDLVAQHDSAQPETLLNNDLPFYIGAQVEKTDNGFNNVYTANMLLNDLRLYDDALSPEEIKAEYNNDRAKYPAALQIPANRTHLTVLDNYYDYMGKDFDPLFQRKLPITLRYEKDIPADPFLKNENMTGVIRNGNQQPELVINGQREYPLMFYGITYNSDINGNQDVDVASVKNGVRDFAAANINLVAMGAFPDNFWLGEGQYDWEKFDAPYHALIKGNPQARIMIGVGSYAPLWFDKKYPNELTQFTVNGRTQTMRYTGPLGSELWLKISTQMVRDVVEHVEASSYANHVYAYNIGGGQSMEWYWPGSMKGTPDQSPATRDSFRVWLRAKYNNDAALQRAWNNPEVTLNTALVPSPEIRARVDLLPFLDPAKSRQEIDFRQYMTDTTVRHILETARVTKEASRRQKLVVTYYGYAMSAAGKSKLANSGLQGFHKVLSSPDIDGTAHLNTYSKRNKGQSGQGISPYYATARLHGKMLWQENDYRTHLAFPHHTGRMQDAAETVSVLQRNFGETLVNNGGFWERVFSNNWMHDNAIMEAWANMKRIGEASLSKDKTSVAEVAFIHDDSVPFYLSGGRNAFISDLVFGTYENAVRMGAPFDFYLMQDFKNQAKKLPNYKMYIFLNAWRMDTATRNAINAKVRKNNAVTVWMYAPGFIDANNNDTFRLSTMKSLTGFTFKNAPTGKTVQWEDKNHPISRLSDKIQTQTTGVTFGTTNADKVLASTSVGGALAVKEMDHWRSVYSGIPLTSEMLQGLCDYAGVHIYSRSYDVLYANKSYVMLYTSKAGKKTISLPHSTNVREEFSNQTIASNVKQFSEQVPAGTARLYLLTR